MNDLNGRYFNWLCDIVGKKTPSILKSHRKLMRLLHDTSFSYSIPMDANRFEDGIELRYKFGSIMGVPYAEIANELDTRACSVLEMMVALCIKIEVGIMSNDDIGDRTGSWFWNMIKSLGLMGMTDMRIDSNECREIIETFINREYEPDGRGGLFTMDNPAADLRNIEIWMQAMWFLDEIIGR